MKQVYEIIGKNKGIKFEGIGRMKMTIKGS